MIGVDVETLCDDLVDKLDEAEGEFLGVKVLDVVAETFRKTMVDNLAEAEVKLLGPKPVTLNTETVGKAVDERLVKVEVKLLGVKLGDLEDKTVVAVDFVTFYEAMIEMLSEKEDELLRVDKTLRVFAEFLVVTLIQVMAAIPGKPVVE